MKVLWANMTDEERQNALDEEEYEYRIRLRRLRAARYEDGHLSPGIDIQA